MKLTNFTVINLSLFPDQTLFLNANSSFLPLSFTVSLRTVTEPNSEKHQEPRLQANCSHNLNLRSQVNAKAEEQMKLFGGLELQVMHQYLLVTTKKFVEAIHQN